MESGESNMAIDSPSTNSLASANAISNMAVDLPTTDPVAIEDTSNNQVVDRLSATPPTRPDPNTSDRQPPRPQDMVKSNVSSGQKFYVVTCGRAVGIFNLLWVNITISPNITQPLFLGLLPLIPNAASQVLRHANSSCGRTLSSTMLPPMRLVTFTSRTRLLSDEFEE